jgi:hypothetical protein
MFARKFLLKIPSHMEDIFRRKYFLFALSLSHSSFLVLLCLHFVFVKSFASSYVLHAEAPAVCFEPAVSGVALNVLMQESWDLDSLQINVINRCTEGSNHTAVLLDIAGAPLPESIHGMSWCHLGFLYAQFAIHPVQHRHVMTLAAVGSA